MNNNKLDPYSVLISNTVALQLEGQPHVYGFSSPSARRSNPSLASPETRSAAIPACTATPGPSVLTVTFHFPLSRLGFGFSIKHSVLVTDRDVQPIESQTIPKRSAFRPIERKQREWLRREVHSRFAGIVAIGVLLHRNHGEMGSGKKGHGVAIEKRGVGHGRFGRRRGSGGRLKEVARV